MVYINTSFKNFLKQTILNCPNIKHFYLKNHPNTKYTLDDILNDVFYVLKTGISWRDLKSPIHWQSVYFHFKRFVDHDIFKHFYILLRNKYFANNNTNIQIIDSTFIANKYGKNKIARNVFFKNKNCNKISLLTDINGVPLSVLINSGNVHDNSFINSHINDIFVLNKNKNKKQFCLLIKRMRAKILEII